MKIFKYCNKQLSYVPYSRKYFLKLTTAFVCCSLIMGWIFFMIFNKYYQQHQMMKLNEEIKLIIIKEHNKFNKTAMVQYMKQINIKFPHIVYAQAILESTDFTSNIFKENNNCFGMKVATSRQTTNQGAQYDHAVFETWKDCVIDYALYQARYLSSIKNEEQYFEYLEQSYAEDTAYVNKLRNIIKLKQLKQLFK